METVFAVLGLNASTAFEAAAPEHLHPGRTAAVKLNTERGWETIGFVGQLHPDVQLDHDLDDTFVAEIDLDLLYDAADRSIVYRTLPRYPAANGTLLSPLTPLYRQVC